MDSKTTSGIGFGVVMSMIISWSVHHSIGWMIVHGMMSWIYVIYRWIAGGY